MNTLPDPVPAHDEYLIEVRAAATNFFDLLQISGKYQHVRREWNSVNKCES